MTTWNERCVLGATFPRSSPPGQSLASTALVATDVVKEFLIYPPHKTLRFSSLILLVFALGISGLVGCSDGQTIADPPQPEGAIGEFELPIRTGSMASRGWSGSEFGCMGSIWLPRKGESRAITLPIHLPKWIVDAADGAVGEFRFVLPEADDPGGRALLDVTCTLPDVDDPRVEKAYERVARFLARNLKALQEAADAGAQADSRREDGNLIAADWSTAQLNTEATCAWVLIDQYINEDGQWVYVYGYQCSGGGGGGDDGGIGGGGGGGGGELDPPSHCAMQTVPTPECEIGEGPYATPWDALDFIALAWSLHDFLNHPSWKNALYVGADAIGAALPIIPSLGTIRRGARILSGNEVWGMYMDLRRARQTKGVFGLPPRTRADAEILGYAWVGEGYTVASGGRTLVSADKLRQYRPPSWKGKIGRWQANLEWRTVPSGKWTGNGHIDILDP